VNGEQLGGRNQNARGESPAMRSPAGRPRHEDRGQAADRDGDQGRSPANNKNRATPKAPSSARQYHDQSPSGPRDRHGQPEPSKHLTPSHHKPQIPKSHRPTTGNVQKAPRPAKRPEWNNDAHDPSQNRHEEAKVPDHHQRHKRDNSLQAVGAQIISPNGMMNQVKNSSPERQQKPRER